MTGKFLQLRLKYISEIWTSLSNEKKKGVNIKEILEKYPYSKYSYLEESGIERLSLIKQHINNLRFTWLCINNAQQGVPLIQQIINESGMTAAVKKFSEIKDEIDTKYYFNENEMNNFGYSLMNENKIDKAIEIFKMNVA
jgi:outer membrane protein assembly factor BamD (BamD/ComL family)